MSLNYQVTTLLESELELTEIKNTGKHTKRIWKSGELIFIELTKGYCTVTEAYNLDDVIKHDWFVQCACVKAGIVCRAVTNHALGLHQYLTGIGFGEGYSAEITIDHVNREPLDNRIKNFRVATKRQQLMNRTPRVTKSGYRGVTKPIDTTSYTVSMTIIDDGKSRKGYVSGFHTARQAAIAFNFLALSLNPDMPLEFLNDIDSIL